MSAEADLVIARHFSAPLDQVLQAWTDCDQVSRWWGPQGYTTPFCRIDLRVGGTFLICMRSPEGKDLWSTGTYRDIVPQSLIVSTDSFSDENGSVVAPTHYGFGPDFPEELLLIVKFEERDGGTALTIRHRGIPLGEDYGNTRIGWSEPLGKLAGVLEPVAAGTAL
jgi:uncharacterized protein YndB with AHSA1/START domain